MIDSLPNNASPTALALDDALNAVVGDGTLSCTAAFALAHGNGVAPERIGRAVDRLGVRLSRCQLGLFGHGPGKKAITLPETVPSNLAVAIGAASHNGCLPCADAWRIADRFDWPKQAIAGACDQLSVKIKPCQLGAF